MVVAASRPRGPPCSATNTTSGCVVRAWWGDNEAPSFCRAPLEPWRRGSDDRDVARVGVPARGDVIAGLLGVRGCLRGRRRGPPVPVRQTRPGDAAAAAGVRRGRVARVRARGRTGAALRLPGARPL